ncbi:unnamed protein product [Pleuronectes platessa]|uniref:Uncharacterized protein n=1 Tax=Pleuronectes platessa TaxID=8262 RepID=A0A9N7Z3W9_PLEPL|nr:unnamed protein product [Pleuronectes platessa]
MCCSSWCLRRQCASQPRRCGDDMTALDRKKGKDLRGQQVFLRPEESSAPAQTTRQSTTPSEQLQFPHRTEISITSRSEASVSV